MKGLTEKELQDIRDELSTSKRPIFLFDDDADGVTSFLLLYRFIKEGKGVIIKSRPLIDTKFVKSVIDYDADKVFILDIATMEQDFVDQVKRPVVWIDHHGVQDLQKVKYFNPRVHVSDVVYPTSNLCYDVVEDDLWLAMCGCIGDWMIPHFKDEFCEKYPDLMDPAITHPGEVLFDTELGKLVRILGFNLKGSTRDAMKSVKVLTRVNSPYEILRQESPQGKFIFKRYEQVNKEYSALLADVKKQVKEEDKFLVYRYQEDKMSFTSDLSNELLYRYPEKIIIIAREKSGEMRMSLRSSKLIIPPLLEKALVGIEGYGGGHEHACGCCVKKEQFDEFLSHFEQEIEKEE